MIINIFGPSGSGKTTLIRNLLKSNNIQKFFEKFTNKEFNTDLNKKISISLIPLPKFRGTVEDLFNIFSINLEQLLNLDNELQSLSKSIFKEIITKKGLREIGIRKIETFSAGETRRLFLLKSLLLESELMIIDEPFSNSDKKLWKLIFEAIYINPKSIILSHVPLKKHFIFNKEDISINVNLAREKFKI